ncbi:MAG: hypothetical protein QOD03_1243 [Verrucomicrobiota bacterium]
MQDAANSEFVVRKNFRRAFHREITHADDPFGAQNIRRFPQMRITRREERGSLGGWELVGRAIAATRFHEGQRAIIHDEMFREKVFWIAKTFGEQIPQAPAADF